MLKTAMLLSNERDGHQHRGPLLCYLGCKTVKIQFILPWKICTFSKMVAFLSNFWRKFYAQPRWGFFFFVLLFNTLRRWMWSSTSLFSLKKTEFMRKRSGRRHPTVYFAFYEQPASDPCICTEQQPALKHTHALTHIHTHSHLLTHSHTPAYSPG